MSEVKSIEEVNQAADQLSKSQAVFVVKALLAAGHVGQWQVQKAIELAETINA